MIRVTSWIGGGPRGSIIADPDALGYRLVADPLLDIMSAEEWYEVERAAANPAC
ncbi:MAG TPA: hypothetical protein VK501_16280 [Baekduia sp.]|uniref:hypothetical protein n=1 Tax=Baekduia sp. TaxID=2600305 RepID=UPI002CE1F54D|nr:hypothetical protein [Baekduia sp.]HMJ35467.1 hypothetical protein [Baekduia sp.]